MKELSPIAAHKPDVRATRGNLHLEITEHIFANSPTMLALCLTSIGLIKIYASMQRITTLADDALVVSVVSFLLATVSSYLALRATMGRFKVAMTRVADALFLVGLVVACIVAIAVVRSLAG